MRDERLFGFGGKSQSASGRRRRGRRYRPSNEGLVPYRFHMVPNSADDDVFIKLETTSMRSIHRQVEKRNSSALNTQCGLLPDPWTQENPPQRPKTLMNTKDAEAPKTPKVEEKTENQENSAAKGAINKFDKPPVPARPSNPLRFKTELCRAHEEGGHCRFGTACTFAHGPTELRLISRHHKYKTEACRSYHSVGYCQYGTRCHFVHDSEDSPVVTPLDKLPSHDESEFFGSTMNNLLESIGIKYKSPPLQEKLKVNDLHGPQNFDKDERVLLVPKLAIPSPSAVDKSDTFMDVVLPSPPVETSKTFMDMFLYSPTMENSKAFLDFYLPSPHVENAKTFDDLFLPSLERSTSLKTDTEDWLPEEKYQSFMDNLLEPRLHGTNKMWAKTLSSSIKPSSSIPSFSSTSEEEAWCRDLDALPRYRSFLPAKTSETPSKTDFGLNSLDKFSFGDAHVSMYTAELSSAVAESVFSETTDRPLNLISPLASVFYPKS